MIITKDDYVLRDLSLADEPFMYDTMRDFPTGPKMTLDEIRKLMSSLLMLTEGFDADRVSTPEGAGHCMILEYQGVPTTFRYTYYQDNQGDVRLAATHPTARGNGMFQASAHLHGHLYFEVLGIESVSFDLVDTPDVNASAAGWRALSKERETSRESRYNPDQKLSRLTVTSSMWKARIQEYPQFLNPDLR